MSTEVANAPVMPREADHDIKTMLFLLQAAGEESEGTGGAGDVPSSGAEKGSNATPTPGWRDYSRAYWREKKKLVEDLAVEKAKVARLEKYNKELIKENSQYKVDLDWEKARFLKLQTEIGARVTHAEARRAGNAVAQDAYELEQQSRQRHAQKKADENAKEQETDEAEPEETPKERSGETSKERRDRVQAEYIQKYGHETQAQRAARINHNNPSRFDAP